AATSGPWIDAQRQLFIETPKFPWDTLRIQPINPFTAIDPWGFFLDLFDHPLHWAPIPEGQRFGSLFNPEPRLRIVRRGVRWIAMHWDKRDDDLLTYQGLPKTVELANGDRPVQVRPTPKKWLGRPPMVPTAYFWWESADTIAVAFLTPLFQEVLDNV